MSSLIISKSLSGCLLLFFKRIADHKWDQLLDCSTSSSPATSCNSQQSTRKRSHRFPVSTTPASVCGNVWMGTSQINFGAIAVTASARSTCARQQRRSSRRVCTQTGKSPAVIPMTLPKGTVCTTPTVLSRRHHLRLLVLSEAGLRVSCSCLFDRPHRSAQTSDSRY
jgi:hypothetical protein